MFSIREYAGGRGRGRKRRTRRKSTELQKYVFAVRSVPERLVREIERERERESERWLVGGGEGSQRVEGRDRDRCK
jgi:hypothetical protein